MTDQILGTLRAGLSPSEKSRALREARYATAWVYEVIKRLATDKTEGAKDA